MYNILVAIQFEVPNNACNPDQSKNIIIQWKYSHACKCTVDVKNSLDNNDIINI